MAAAGRYWATASSWIPEELVGAIAVSRVASAAWTTEDLAVVSVVRTASATTAVSAVGTTSDDTAGAAEAAVAASAGAPTQLPATAGFAPSTHSPP